jgi:hypothetical protein
MGVGNEVISSSGSTCQPEMASCNPIELSIKTQSITGRLYHAKDA